MAGLRNDHDVTTIWSGVDPVAALVSATRRLGADELLHTLRIDATQLTTRAQRVCYDRDAAADAIIRRLACAALPRGDALSTIFRAHYVWATCDRAAHRNRGGRYLGMQG